MEDKRSNFNKYSDKLNKNHQSKILKSGRSTDTFKKADLQSKNKRLNKTNQYNFDTKSELRSDKKTNNTSYESNIIKKSNTHKRGEYVTKNFQKRIQAKDQRYDGFKSSPIYNGSSGNEGYKYHFNSKKPAEGKNIDVFKKSPGSIIRSSSIKTSSSFSKHTLKQFKKSASEDDEKEKSSVSQKIKQENKKFIKKKLRKKVFKKAGSVNPTNPIRRAMRAVLKPKTPLGWGMVGAIGAFVGILVVIMSVMAIFTGMGNSLVTAHASTSFLATDEDIKSTESKYVELEKKMRSEIENIRNTHPGYEDYSYDLGEIGHSPYELAAYLTCKFNEYKYSDPEVQKELISLFNSQYKVVYTEYQKDGKRGILGEIRVKSLNSLAAERLDDFAYERYRTILSVYGNSEVFGDNGKTNYNPNSDVDYSSMDFSKDLPASELQKRIASIAKNNAGTQPATAGWCAAWVSGVYQAAGLPYPGGNAIDFWYKWKDTGSTDMSKCPIGAAVVTYPTDGNRPYGHIGIYIGNGMIANNIGGVVLWSIEKFDRNGGIAGWVYPNGVPFN